MRTNSSSASGKIPSPNTIGKLIDFDFETTNPTRNKIIERGRDSTYDAPDNAVHYRENDD